MGIKGLTGFLRKKYPQVFKQTTINSYAGKKVAVDVSLFLYKYKVVFNEGWGNALINLMVCMRKNDVHPVLVLDGDAPEEKMEEQMTRRETRKAREDNLELMSSLLSCYQETAVIDDRLNEFFIKHTKPKPGKSNKEAIKKLLGESYEKDKKFDGIFVEKKIEELSKQNVKITSNDIHSCIEIANVMGIQYIQANGEAEALCAYLAVKGDVSAVLSEDSDVLVYGAVKLLTKISTDSGFCIELDRDYIINEMGFTEQQFVDFCILMGCDYNSNVKGFGPVKCFNMINKYKNIEAIIEADTKNNFDCIKYERTRELFHVPDDVEFSSEHSINPVKTDIHTLVFENNYIINPDMLYKACYRENSDTDINQTTTKIKSTYVPRRSPSKKSQVIVERLLKK